MKAIFWGQPNQTNIVRPGEPIVPPKRGGPPPPPNETTFVSAVTSTQGHAVFVTLSDTNGYASVTAEWQVLINGVAGPIQGVDGQGTSEFVIGFNMFGMIVEGDVVTVSHLVADSGIVQFIDQPVTNIAVPAAIIADIELPLTADRYLVGSTTAGVTLNRDSVSSIIGHLGYPRTIFPHELGLSWARRNENIIYGLGASGTDLTQGWVATTAAIIDSETVAFEATTNGRITVPITSVANTEYSVAFDAWTDVGTAILRLSMGPSPYGGNVTITTERKRYQSRMLRPEVSSYLGIRNAQNVASTVHITNVHFEVLSDTANLEPADFIGPNDSACSFNDIPVKYYDTFNGNTVDAGGIVTEAPGTPIGVKGVDVDGRMLRLLSVESSTNTALSSDNLLNNWTASNGAAIDSEELVQLPEQESKISTGTSIPAGTTATISADVRTPVGWGWVRLAFDGGALSDDLVLAGPGYHTVTFTGVIVNPSISVVNGFQSGDQAVFVERVQVEAKPYATPPIYTDGAEATRQPDDAKYAQPALRNNMVVVLDWFPSLTIPGFLLGNSGWSIEYDGTNIIANKGVNSATIAAPIVVNTRYSVKARYDDVTGIDVFFDDVVGTNNPNIDYIAQSADTQVGCDSDLANYQNGNYGNIKVVSGNLTNAEVIAL